MSLPTVTDSHFVSMMASTRELMELQGYLDELLIYQPVLSTYFATISTEKDTYTSQEAVLIGITTYLLLKNASESSDIEKLLGEKIFPTITPSVLNKLTELVKDNKEAKNIWENFCQEQPMLVASYKLNNEALGDLVLLYAALKEVM